MKSRITAGLTALAMLGSAMPMAAFPVMTSITASAADYTEETYGEMTIHKYATYVEIAGCSNGLYFNDNPSASLTIPDTIDGLPVISLGRAAFNMTAYETITLPAGLISIGDNAFYGCKNLKRLSIPDSVTSLGTQAFYNCESLTSVDLPKYLTMIDSNTFFNCTSLKTITIPSTVTSIGAEAFSNSGLTEVTIPGSVESMKTAFKRCKSLKKVVIEEGATGIGSTFADCSALQSVSIPSTMVFIQSDLAGAFQNCTSLTDVKIAEGATYVGTRAGKQVISANGTYMFSGCTSLKHIDLPDSFDYIPNSMFSGCSALESIEIPSTCCIILSSAFEGCSALTEVTVPAGVEKISNQAFQDCGHLEKITILNKDCEIDSGAGAICNYTLNGKRYFNGTIYGYDNSTAQNYAKKQGYHFEPIGSTPGVTLGDLDASGAVNASDAAKILIAAAAAGAGGELGLTDAQMAAADLNGDNIVNASDAALVLIYAAYVGAGGTDSLPDFLKTR